MKRLLPLAFALAAVVSFFPRLDAQNRNRMFTTGTAAELAQARTLGLQRLRALAQEKAIDGPDDLVVTNAHVDRQSKAHTRVQQRFHGIPVLRGEAIAHFNEDGTSFAETDNLIADINVNTTPLVSQAAAIDAAVLDYGCRTCLTGPARADLWIVRDDDGVDHLTYRVQLTRMDGTANTALPVRFIDAQGGQVVLSYDNLQTGTGNSLYSGTVSIGTYHNPFFGDYVMENLGLHVGTFDMRNGTSCCYLFLDTDDNWDASDQRAGVDAHYGMERFFTYLSTVHGRNGIDGAGGPFVITADDGVTPLAASLVHFSTNFNNAFWDGTNMLMVYGDGDGSQFGPLVTLDIAGHEMTHGVTQFTAGLIYQGESGALNESWSDVFGAMLERYVKGESANTWLLAEQAYTPGTPGDALRYMDNPHLASNKGFTADDDPDHYSERYTGASDNGGVHINSGISNKVFYLLANGGSHHLGGSMTGIGADAAAQIWYTALSSYMTSGTNFAGARLATKLAAGGLYGVGSTQHQAVEKAWCLVGVCSPIGLGTVSPNSGTGVTQTFTLTYTDTLGVTADLNGALVRFASVANPAVMCMIQHKATTNQVRIRDDAGVWGPFMSYGSGTLSNSRCSLDLVTSSATPSGNSLMLSYNLTFLPALTGPATIAMRAQSLTGDDTGFLPKGTWTVGGVSVGAVSITPNSGTGVSQTFSAVFTDSLGVSTDLLRARVRFGPNGVGTCVVDYDAIANKVRMLDDSGTAGPFVNLGTGTISNSQCIVDLAQTNGVPSGTSLTVNLAVTFKPAFVGPHPIFMRAVSSFGTDTGWLAKGTFTVGAALDAVSITPNTGTGVTQTFSAVFTDSLGVSTDLLRARVRFGPNGVGTCVVDYDAIANKVRMLDDSGTAGPFVNLGTGTISNSQCIVDLAQTNGVPSGTSLTVNLAVTFKPTFIGPHPIFLRAVSSFGTDTGWLARGTWNVNAVQAISITPVNGSSAGGAAQTFVLAFSDSEGVAADLLAARVRFRTASGVQCNISYNAVLNQVRVMDNAGILGPFMSFGAGAYPDNNNQCTLDLASSSAVRSGNDLTLTLRFTFKAAFVDSLVGSKTVAMLATSTVGWTTGWVNKGTWTVTP